MEEDEPALVLLASLFISTVLGDGAVVNDCAGEWPAD